jgi:pyridoxine 4-dehydrogenase
MSQPDATKSGTFKIGGDIPVHRLGFGAMRVTGEGVWGEPRDRGEAIATLKRLPHLNVNFIDTAHAYGPETSEKLIHEALHPYKGMLIATKGGLDRPGPGNWIPNGRPDVLIAQANRSRELLKVEQIGNCIASIRKCRRASSSPPSRHSSMKA